MKASAPATPERKSPTSAAARASGGCQKTTAAPTITRTVSAHGQRGERMKESLLGLLTAIFLRRAGLFYSVRFCCVGDVESLNAFGEHQRIASIRYRIEKLTGVTMKVLCDYEAGGRNVRSSEVTAYPDGERIESSRAQEAAQLALLRDPVSWCPRGESNTRHAV